MVSPDSSIIIIIRVHNGGSNYIVVFLGGLPRIQPVPSCMLRRLAVISGVKLKASWHDTLRLFGSSAGGPDE